MGKGGSRSRAAGDKPQIFPDITSRDVNAYLSGILPGLTAKVFRTHHATMTVRDSLEGSGVEADDPEYDQVGGGQHGQPGGRHIVQPHQEGAGRLVGQPPAVQGAAAERRGTGREIPGRGQDGDRERSTHCASRHAKKREAASGRPAPEGESSVRKKDRAGQAAAGGGQGTASQGPTSPGQDQGSGRNRGQKAHLEPGHESKIVHRSPYLLPVGAAGGLRRAGGVLPHDAAAEIRVGER